MKRIMVWFFTVGWVAAVAGCSSNAASATTPQAAGYPTDAWALWQPGPWLRGANIYQRRVYPELDGELFYGPGPFGPPYTQKDFDALAEQGANWVVLSVMGPYTVTPPYRLDPAALEHIAHLVDMAWQADLFVTLAVRSGPGRSEFSILRDGLNDWFGPEYLHEEVWTEPAARLAWAAMWQTLAQRFHEHPAVVGYELMVEPNANDIVGIYDPETFDEHYQGTGYDWNVWYPDLVAAIREVDPETPILVSPLDYASPQWLGHLKPVQAPHVVYSVHLYEPFAYTHQNADTPDAWHYPGRMALNDASEAAAWVDQAALEEAMSAIAANLPHADARIAITETGIMRWEPGAAAFMRDRLDAAERHGLNYAIWMWYPDWPALNQPQGDHAFNFRLGSQANHFAITPENALWRAYRAMWRRNTVRPSLWGAIPQGATAPPLAEP